MNNNGSNYQVKAGEFIFSFSGDEIAAIDINQKNEETFSIIREHRSVHAIIRSGDANSKKINVEVDGESFDIEIKDELDQMLEQMGFDNASTKQVKEIKAPMPGLVLEISVQDGQEVKEGNRLLILEAMKMENSIMIGRDATIRKVNVKAGQAVEKGQVLVELE